MTYECIKTGLPEVKLIKPRAFPDTRGFFQQLYHEQEYRKAGIDVRFVQDNWSHSAKGTLRGLHYQLKHAQDKLVCVIQGEIFDVVVDIRRNSPTFGRWAGEILSAENRCQLFVPKGFAHGFCVLSETADVLYKCSDFYAPGDEYGVLWSDTVLQIDWPVQGVVLSGKDRALPALRAVRTENLPVYTQAS